MQNGIDCKRNQYSETKDGPSNQRQATPNFLALSMNCTFPLYKVVLDYSEIFYLFIPHFILGYYLTVFGSNGN